MLNIQNELHCLTASYYLRCIHVCICANKQGNRKSGFWGEMKRKSKTTKEACS